MSVHDELEEIVALRQEIRLLRTGQLFARLTEAEKEELAARVAERLEPVIAALQQKPAEMAPKRREKRKRGLFASDD